MYIYEGPTTVNTLIIDRLTEEAHVVVNGLTSLKEVKIMTGTDKICGLITVPPTVDVIVDNKPCVRTFLYLFFLVVASKRILSYFF